MRLIEERRVMAVLLSGCVHTARNITSCSRLNLNVMPTCVFRVNIHEYLSRQILLKACDVLSFAFEQWVAWQVVQTYYEKFFLISIEKIVQIDGY